MGPQTGRLGCRWPRAVVGQVLELHRPEWERDTYLILNFLVTTLIKPKEAGDVCTVMCFIEPKGSKLSAHGCHRDGTALGSTAGPTHWLKADSCVLLVGFSSCTAGGDLCLVPTSGGPLGWGSSAPTFWGGPGAPLPPPAPSAISDLLQLATEAFAPLPYAGRKGIQLSFLPEKSY